ncbi:PREDICTED: RNA-binding protein 26 isoform X1 [Wasmannia auropunctata]|uniref:RNA-binding protein 26 isoform X1 n=1 Tax=Wasmannia auropunctata TaxID=64793 RepID=UPI0005EE578C|nr:PREDICTED: RNA-binding protein 26 isoform X1 [Wasmannia auropunctata]
MIINNPEAFKAWLTGVLAPLCDADPAALAKYVYALVKKDKTMEELRSCMVEQLDVFLQHETNNFVEMLFKVLETQEYVIPPPKSDPDGGGTPPGANPPIPIVSSSTEKIIEATIPLVPIITNPPVPIQINGSAPAVISKRETRKSDSDKDKEKEKRSRSRSGRMRSRTRSRSRSWERDRRRSRSREHIRRDRERDRSRPWRNESPPISTRRHDRRRTRSRSTSPIRPRIRDGPDSRDHRARFRNRSPTPLRSRSRSRSIERKKIDRFERIEVDRTDRIEGSPGGGTPTQDSNHGDVDMRLSTTSQSIQSVVAVASSIPNNQTGSFQQQAKRRCRDFDEKGYCMRGDLCPYDHGTDPVVLEDVALSRVLSFGPHSAQAPGTVPVSTVPEPPQGPNGNPPPPHLPLASLPPPHLRNHHSNMDAFAEYNPDAPSMEPRMPWRHPQPAPGIYGRGQRELISVPVIPHTNSSEITHTQSNPLKRKQTFDFNRLGPKQRVVHNPANCSLELKKVPRSLNNITQLNNHFSKFGKIVNIQVNFGGDPEAALVTFQLPVEAKSAYRSAEAVLNNRFIKVFWHNNVNNNAAGGAIENVPPGCRPSVKERLGAAVTLPAKTEDNEYVPTRRSTEEQVTQALVPTSPKAAVVPTREDKVLAIKKTQEILAAKETLKKKQEEKRKEAMKLTADLRKRKQELLDKHLIELRGLIDKAEKNPEQKESIMPTIKAMQQSVDNLRKDLAANGQIGGSKSQVKSREQAQKEILDAELDLMTAQQEGQDAGELQKRLNELRAQAAALGLNTNPGVGRGAKVSSRVARGTHALSFRGRGRGSFAHVSVDHRPTSLLVSGYETEEKAEVLAHFQQFGEIVNQIVDDATPSIVINFKSRKEAEVALVKGRTFQDRLLSITWVSGHHLHRGGANTNSSASIQLSSRSEQTAPTADEDIDLEGTEALLLEENEEEEDEDVESRSWRR